MVNASIAILGDYVAAAYFDLEVLASFNSLPERHEQ